MDYFGNFWENCTFFLLFCQTCCFLLVLERDFYFPEPCVSTERADFDHLLASLGFFPIKSGCNSASTRGRQVRYKKTSQQHWFLIKSTLIFSLISIHLHQGGSSRVCRRAQCRRQEEGGAVSGEKLEWDLFRLWLHWLIGCLCCKKESSMSAWRGNL